MMLSKVAAAGCLAVLVVVGVVEPLHAVTAAEAEAVTSEFDRSHQRWLVEMELAKSSGSVALVAQKKPDAASSAKRLKVLISRDLEHEWTLQYGAWLLENDPGLTPEHQRALLGAVEKYHVKSSEVGRFCMGMIYLNQMGEMPRSGQPPIRSRGMNLLRTIKKENPDAKVQGQASLALSMMLAQLGDDARVMKERIKNLREAILKSAEVKVGAFTVAKIAEDELYKITHLSKGRVAPDIRGLDSAGAVMELSQFRGKVVMLVFWSSWDPESARLLDILRKNVSANAGKPFVVLGVNRDSRKNLRLLEAEGLVTWRNFSDPEQSIPGMYRVASWPFCMVLDQKGVIHYRGNVGSFADAVVQDVLRR